MVGLRDAGLVDELAARGITVTGIEAEVSKRMIIPKCDVAPPTNGCLDNPDGRTLLNLNQSKFDIADVVVVALGSNGDTSKIRQQTYDMGVQINQLGVGPDGKAPEALFVGLFGANKNVDAINRNAEIEAAVADLNTNGYRTAFVDTADFVDTTLRPQGGMAQPKDLPDVHPNALGYDLLKVFDADQIASAVQAYHSELYPTPLITPVEPTPAQEPIIALPELPAPKTNYIDLPLLAALPEASLPDVAASRNNFLDLRLNSSGASPLAAPRYLDLRFDTIAAPVEPVTPGPTAQDPAVIPPPTSTVGSSLPDLLAVQPPVDIPQPLRILPGDAQLASVEQPPEAQLPAPEGLYTPSGLLVPENASGSEDAELVLPVGDPWFIADNGEYAANRRTYKHAGIDFTQHNPSGWADVVASVDGVVESVDYTTDPDHPSAGVNVVIATDIGPSELDSDGIVYLQYRELTDGSIPDDIQVGSVVHPGQVIGGFGHNATTGASEGPHVHFGAMTEDPLTDPRGMATKAIDGYTLDPGLLGFRELDGSIVSVDGAAIDYSDTIAVPRGGGNDSADQQPETTVPPSTQQPPAGTIGGLLDLNLGGDAGLGSLLPGLDDILANPLPPVIPDSDDSNNDPAPTDSAPNLPNVPGHLTGGSDRGRGSDENDDDQTVTTPDDEATVGNPTDDTSPEGEDTGSNNEDDTGSEQQPEQPSPDAAVPPAAEAPPADPEQPAEPVAPEAPPVAEPALPPAEADGNESIPEYLLRELEPIFGYAGTYGVMGNFFSESGGNPMRSQIGWDGTDDECGQVPERLDPSHARKEGTLDGTKGWGFGWPQFTYWTLQKDMQAVADEMSLPWYSKEAQIEYLRRLFTEGGYYEDLGNRMRATDNVTEATKMFLNEFEKPAIRNLEARANKAHMLQAEMEAGNAASIDIACDGVGRN
jgi:murein DD-endopeptidase MepM/ murein hydrolase activator NlpD